MKKKPVVEMKNISKSFGGIKALDNVNLTLQEGEVLGLVGDNGAGKSTLIKILTGVYTKDEGKIYLYGEEKDIKKPIDARKMGIETIFQDLALVENFTAVENMFLAKEITKKFLNFNILQPKKMKEEAYKTLKDIGLDTEITDSVVNNLSGGQQQAVAISKAIYWDAKIIIMDEPTAALGVQESEKVFNLIKRLKKQNISILIISHNMEEIVEITDRVSVLRLGKNNGTKETKSTSKNEIVELIMGANKV